VRVKGRDQSQVDLVLLDELHDSLVFGMHRPQEIAASTGDTIAAWGKLQLLVAALHG